MQPRITQIRQTALCLARRSNLRISLSMQWNLRPWNLLQVNGAKICPKSIASICNDAADQNHVVVKDGNPVGTYFTEEPSCNASRLKTRLLKLELRKLGDGVRAGQIHQWMKWRLVTIDWTYMKLWSPTEERSEKSRFLESSLPFLSYRLASSLIVRQ